MKFPGPRKKDPPAGNSTAGSVADDAELLRRIGHGDQAAFGQLVDRHGAYLYGVARALVQSADDADDLVQETFVGVLGSKFRGESQVRTWLVRILINRAAMLRRSKARRGGEAKEVAGGGESLASTDPPIASGVAAKLDLAAMLEMLSEEHRQVIVLRELEGLSYEEMARTLNVPRGTVESRLHRAREELRRRFKGYLS
jgi:RNA polymerase sigma-70 factor (ECF subfamily)